MLDKKLLKPEQKIALNILETIENNLLKNDFIESSIIINDIPSIATMKKEIIDEYKTKLLFYFEKEKNDYILNCINSLANENEQKKDIPIQQPNPKKCVKEYVNEIRNYHSVNIIDSEKFINSKLGSEFTKAVLWSGSTKDFIEKYIGIFANAVVVEKTNRIRLLSTNDEQAISLLIYCTEEQKDKINYIINELKNKTQI